MMKGESNYDDKNRIFKSTDHIRSKQMPQNAHDPDVRF